jgi:hypothetical protein
MNRITVITAAPAMPSAAILATRRLTLEGCRARDRIPSNNRTETSAAMKARKAPGPTPQAMNHLAVITLADSNKGP